MKYHVTIVFLFIISNLFAQSGIQGRVLAPDNQTPITFASVYIDGTTRITQTNDQGYFSLPGVLLPCKLVISHLTYDKKVLELTDTTQNLTIYLTERSLNLQHVEVHGVNKRTQTLKEFKQLFTGTDKWGKSALIKKESNLRFWHQTDTIYSIPDKSDTLLLQYNKKLGDGYGWTGDSSRVFQSSKNLHAKSVTPFTVELPLLGYDLLVELEDFKASQLNRIQNVESKTSNCFIPRLPKNEKEQKRIEQNREQVYYNSTQHFFRSLLRHQLAENGYLLCYNTFGLKFTDPPYRKYINIDSLIVQKSATEYAIVGLKGQTLLISYLSRSNNRPANLNQRKDRNGKPKIPWSLYSPYELSTLTFDSDTCRVRIDGLISDYTISVGGAMGNKGIGASLPQDYEPADRLLADKTENNISPDASDNETLQPIRLLTTTPNDATAFGHINRFVNSIDSLSLRYPQEKVYLHFDNTAYYPGETIWYKASVVIAAFNWLSSWSKTLYVELISPEGNILNTSKLSIENGQCHGDFQLPDKLRSGFYEVRAYTRYMLNQVEDCIFSRVFPIYEKPAKEGDYNVARIKEQSFEQKLPDMRKVSGQKESLSLTFYPEGGNLVAGLSSRVAFSAIDRNGENATISGEIVNANNVKVAEFHTTHWGMGAFRFTPQAETYQARVQYNHKEYKFNLPRVEPTGYVLTVNSTDNKLLQVRVQQSTQLAGDTLGISLVCRGRLYAAGYIIPPNQSSFSVSKKAIPSGVSQFALFNKQGEIICERLICLNHHPEMKVRVETDKKTLRPHEKISIGFQLTDRMENPVQTTFSVAVSDAASSPENHNGDNILTNLLLSSELKGYIQQPGYYFESDEPERKEALDILMLTQGWTRYSWKQMTGIGKQMTGIGKPVLKHPVELGLLIEGRVLSLLRNKPKANVQVLMFMTLADSTSLQGICTTDSAGRFNFAPKSFTGNARLSLQTKENGKRTENNIVLDRMFSPGLKTYAYQEKHSLTQWKLYADSTTTSTDSTSQPTPVARHDQSSKTLLAEKTIALKEVLVKEKKKFSRETEGVSQAAIVYDVEKEMDALIDQGKNTPATALDLISVQNPYFNWQFGKTELLQDQTELQPNIFKDSADYCVKATYKGRDVILCKDNKAYVALDKFKKLINLDVAYDNILNIPPNQIKTIAINETRGCSLPYGGVTGNEVVVFIYTYDDMHTRNNLKGIRQTRFQGYTQPAEFYHPDYSNRPLPELKDYRRTLYWNPDVRTDSTGKATV